MRFSVPVRTINAAPNSKYFGVGRGVTYYNFTSDQFTGFHGIVIPGTLRDSLFLLSGVLEHQASLDIDQHFAYISQENQEAALKFFDSARQSFAKARAYSWYSPVI